jgi:hypothetical protein
MNHPFDLDPADLEAMDLDFEEPLTDEEAAHVGGGIMATSMMVGEEGGGVTSMMVGEEGGGVTSMMVGEEGGGYPPKPIPIEPPMTTMAIREEGGGYYTKALLEGGGGPIYY